MAANKITVEVAYAQADQQWLLTVQVSRGATVQEAINQSEILKICPEINLANNKVGIFSKSVKLDTILQAGDRIEVYRPLQVDPKIARSLKAKRQHK